jgi:hypothetical protein
MNPIIERDNYFLNPINDRKFPYEHGNKLDRQRAMRACEESLTFSMLGNETTPRALANLNTFENPTDVVNHQETVDAEKNLWAMMLESGREYPAAMRKEIETKSAEFEHTLEQKRKITALKDTEHYRLSLQHARAVVASTKSGGMPDREGRAALLDELERTGDWAVYQQKSHDADLVWYQALDAEAATKRQTAALLESEAKAIESQKI